MRHNGEKKMAKVITEYFKDEVEGRSVGVYQQDNGEFLVLTFTTSKTFKTKKAAIKWFNKVVID